MRKAIWVVFLVTALAVTLIPVSAESADDSTFVGMYGLVNKYGGLPACGRIGAFAEVPDKWAEVGVFWTNEMARIAVLPAIYTFYAARLNTTDMARLSYEGNDFYVSGLWNVYKITIEYDEDANTIRIELDPILVRASGELNVTGGWTTFTVDIEGIELIEGIVHCHRIFPPPYVIIPGDLNLDGTVDIFDLVHVARRHGTKPGIGIPSYDLEYGFDFYSDLNSDYTIDIDDLIIIAKAS